MSKSNVISFNFSGLFLFLFIALKLTGYISWSGGWVFCPLWIPAAVFAAMFVLVVFAAFIKAILE